MDPEVNKQRVFDAIEAFNAGDLDGYVAGYAQDAIVHGLPAEFGNSPEGHRGFLTAMMSALSGLRIDTRTVVAEGDTVAVHLTYSGVHDGGLFLGVRPTGRQLRWPAMVFRRYDEAGRAVERWMISDTAVLRHQLGIDQPAGE